MARWQFWIDVGGTFTDCIAQQPDGTLLQHKTLSSGVIKGICTSASDKNVIVDTRRASDPNGVWNGYSIRLSQSTNEINQFADGTFHLVTGNESTGVYELFSHEPAPLVAIRYLLGLGLHDTLPPIDIRLGTTRGTNALITRSGCRTALVTTAGFRDILRIGYQARPELFAFAIKKRDELFETVVDANERVDHLGNVLLPLDIDSIARSLKQLKSEGIDSLAVALLHACSNNAHERQIADIASNVGFQHVSLSHEVASLRKLVPRGDTTVIDAYLNPVLDSYVKQIQESLHPESNLQIMTSSGGLTSAEKFRGKDSILSGPAGGVVGVANVAATAGFKSAIGFDMGGTSTDVSRWSGDFELEFETEKAGIRVTTPMVAIETVAAGGGSLCQFDGVKLTVGPASAGADPGPACYGKNGPLAVTDINFFLGKIPPAAFPIPLDRHAVEELLDDQCTEIFAATGKQYTTVELANGYFRIATTNMAEAIRCVSVDRGIDPRDDVLVAFGGAAAQHACAVANELGMSQILLHPSAGIMSALGIGLARETVHREAGVYRSLEDVNDLDAIFESLTQNAMDAVSSKSPVSNSPDHFEVTRSLDLRFAGLDEPITIRQDAQADDKTGFQLAYETEYESQCGFLPENRDIEVVTARVAVATIDAASSSQSTRVNETSMAKQMNSQLAYFNAKATPTKYFSRDALQPGHIVVGPSIITESISTIVIEPGWQAEVLSGGELLLSKISAAKNDAEPDSELPDPVEADPVFLEVFNKRFAAIATQMGTTLRKNSRSVNVKERLDYSCAIFTSTGELVVNAPHIPVHLGAMGATVRHVLATLPLVAGDVVVTNDPYHGGSHLPDVTVITPVHSESGELLFLTASRAHHAEIGGITPGSMPAFSKNLAEEGVLIRATKVIDAGESQLDRLREILSSAPYPSRDVEMNIADMTAQIAANRHGATGLLRFVEDYTWNFVSKYMTFIQEAAERKTRQALRKLPDGDKLFVDHLDDGTPISLKLTINGDTAELDFTGTGDVLAGNLNANRAIVTAATLYCLRLLINEDIPLNAGVLKPIQIELPTCLLNPEHDVDPKKCPAIVGGNVETSQRVVDVILGALGIAAASQGTMNNFLFGDASFGYYETICGGSGATPSARGADAVHTHMTNTRLTDPEVLEARFPVRLHQFSIRNDSGGVGEFQGGCGVVREVEFLVPLQVSLVTQRRGEFAPFGVAGGGDGSTGKNELIRADGSVVPLSGIESVSVEVGDRIRIATPGGGGWGKPAEA